MSHARTQIRDYVVGTALDTLRGQTADKVIHSTQFYPRTQYPFIAAHTGNERSLDESNNRPNTAKRYKRALDLTIEIGVKTSTTPEATLDALILLVEQRMYVDQTFGDTVVYSDLRRTAIDPVRDGETPVLIARLTYEVGYRTTAADPETFLR